MSNYIELVIHVWLTRFFFSSVIINTGSKQGITNPPGNAAYNASKAAVKSLTEGLSHELRQAPNSQVTAHLFVSVHFLLST